MPLASDNNKVFTACLLVCRWLGRCLGSFRMRGGSSSSGSSSSSSSAAV
jgi:hypothetical protein